VASSAMSERLRQAYLALPLSNAAKQRLVNIVYRTAGAAFRGMVHYETWRRVHKAVFAEPQPIADLPVSRLEAETRFEPASRLPVVSIVVCAQHGYAASLRCLHRIATNPPAARFEVILIDDACSDPHMHKLVRIPGLRVETQTTAIGYARCCNRVASLARGEYLHFLSDRILIHEGWLDSLLRVFEMRPDCALVGPKLLLADGRLQAAGGVVWRDGSAWHFGHGDNPARSDYSYLRETDYCSGVAMVMRNATFKKLGRFTATDAPTHCEDVDLAFKIRASGARVYFQPASRVSQLQFGDVSANGIGRKQLENARAIRASWASVLEAEHRAYDSGVRIARERLKPQRTVLVLDHYVPKPDRDAGSRSVWDVVTTLVQEGWNVKFRPHTLWYEPGYTESLQQLGVEVVYGAEHSERFGSLLQELGPSLAAVLINRPLVAREYLTQVRRFSKAKVLYYGIDIHYLRLREQARIQGLRPNRELRLMTHLEPRIWKLSDLVLYASDSEVAEVRALDPDIDARVIPLMAFDRFGAPRKAARRDRARLLFVAGFGHPPNRDGALWLMRDVLPILRQRGVAFELQVVGANAPDDLQPFLAADIRMLGPVSDAELDELYQSSDVALVPLRYGAGVKGKVVEALRWGLPLVTTPAGAQGLTGIERIVPICEGTEQFAAQIERVLAAAADWEKISRDMLEFARSRFSRDAMRALLADALRPQRATVPSPRRLATVPAGLGAGA
jgi:glycosyltransferase involved in cell wall biosynthesis